MANTESEKSGNFDNQPKKRSWFGTADAWTALATIGLIAVGIWGVIETRGALKLSERATLSTIGMQLGKVPPEKNAGLKILILFLNSGKGPATDVAHAIRVSTIDSYDPVFTNMTNINVGANATCRGLEPVVGRSVIAPSTGGLANGFIYDTIHAIQPFRVDDRILDGSKFAVVQGCAAYNTVGESHHSAYCYILESQSGDDNKTRAWNFATCSGGFDLD